MHTENVIVIDAAPEIVFELAARIEQWPALLSHYRYVRVHPDREEPTPEGPARVAAMSAHRMRIPVRWESTQCLDRRGGRVIYHHIGGVTRGMVVEWTIDDLAASSYVTIVHDLEVTAGLLRFAPVRWIAGRFFIRGIADRTLRGIRDHAEARARAQGAR